MIKQCPHCRRLHTGICGIPAGVALGFGARVGAATHTKGCASIHGRPRAAVKGTRVLEEMLTQAKEHLRKLNEMLLMIPDDVDLLDRETKLNALIRQITGQIAARR